MNQKSIGVMVPLFSLEGAHGIGDVDSLYGFIDRIKNSGISIIQILPLNALGTNDTSPYSSISAFGMDPIYISLNRLKYLTRTIDSLDSGERVDYEAVREVKFAALRESFEGFKKLGTPLDRKRFDGFSRQHKSWLHPFSLFHAISRNFSTAFWDWDPDLQTLAGAESWAGENSEEVEFCCYLQWIFSEQWSDLKSFAAEHKILFMGDLPLYVSKNSADFWSNPDIFIKGVRAGVPPDLYAAEGQDWGNPIYDWKKMKKDGFLWWQARLQWLKHFFDLIRLDHVRGIFSYWAVPDGKKPNEVSRWTPGPGSALIESLQKVQIELIGEDLGSIPPAVEKWMQDINVPGYKVFLFGWGEYNSSKYRFPETYPENTLACTSTHDSESFLEFLENLDDSRTYELAAYLGIKEGEEFSHLDLLDRVLIRILDCPSRFAIFPLQDILAKPIRINLPGSVGEENWSKIIRLSTHDQERLDQFTQMIASSPQLKNTLYQRKNKPHSAQNGKAHEG